ARRHARVSRPSGYAPTERRARGEPVHRVRPRCLRSRLHRVRARRDTPRSPHRSRSRRQPPRAPCCRRSRRGHPRHTARARRGRDVRTRRGGQRRRRRPPLQSSAPDASRRPRNLYTPDRGPLLQVFPPELAGVLELELVAQRLRVVIVHQHERLARLKLGEGLKDCGVLLARWNHPHIEYSLTSLHRYAPSRWIRIGLRRPASDEYAYELRALLPGLPREAAFLEEGQQELGNPHIELYERAARRELLERSKRAHHRLGRLQVAHVENDHV